MFEQGAISAPFFSAEGVAESTGKPIHLFGTAVVTSKMSIRKKNGIVHT